MVQDLKSPVVMDGQMTGGIRRESLRFGNEADCSSRGSNDVWYRVVEKKRGSSLQLFFLVFLDLVDQKRCERSEKN